MTTYADWLNGRSPWQAIRLEDWPNTEIPKRRLISAGLTTFGDVDFLTDEDMMKLPGMTRATVSIARRSIKTYKAVTARRRRLGDRSGD